VMRDGTCVGELSGDAISGLSIMKLAMGSHS
jgi:hypothetical protein